MPVGSQSTEEVDQNYVPMSANSPSHHHSGSLSEPIHEANYVPMTPSTMEFSSLGKQVPPPAHMGFRSSPKTPPRRPMPSDCQPPPVDRNLKPDRKGERAVGVHACLSVTWFINILTVCWGFAIELMCTKVHLTSHSMLDIRKCNHWPCFVSHSAAIIAVLAHGRSHLYKILSFHHLFSKQCHSSSYFSCH